MRESHHHEALFYPSRDTAHCYYCAQIEIDGKFSGSIGLIDLYAALSPGQIAIARTVRDFLADYLKKNQRNILLEDASSGFWVDLITGGAVEREILNEKLAVRGWQFAESYGMVSFLPEEIQDSSIELASVMNQILLEMPLAIVAVEGQAITALFRTADYGTVSKERLLSFLDAMNLCAGYSFSFPNLSY